MSFLVRILFSGLIAFVPSENGQEVTVLLLNVGHEYYASDSTAISHHTPIVIASGGGCTGDCVTDDEEIATYLYADLSTPAAIDALENACDGGAAWLLDGSDLSLAKGTPNAAELPGLNIVTGVRGVSDVPTTGTERTDYSWVADIEQLCGNGCVLDPDVLSNNPPGLIAARFRLRTGNLYTYSVARFGSNITPVVFDRLDGVGDPSPYAQAVATWVAADVEVEGNSIELIEETFDGTPTRSMLLTPDGDGKVEIAVLNMPPFVPPASSTMSTQSAGKHFEAYYDLSQDPPDAEERFVPMAGTPDPYIEWSDSHSALWSDLLNDLRLEPGRGPYDRVLCPVLNQNP